MYALNFYQNGKQVNQDAGHDKLVRLDLLIVRERLQLASAWVVELSWGNGSTAPTLIVSICIFICYSVFALDKLLEIIYGPMLEFSGAVSATVVRIMCYAATNSILTLVPVASAIFSNVLSVKPSYSPLSIRDTAC
jgi:hypothetical protein